MNAVYFWGLWAGVAASLVLIISAFRQISLTQKQNAALLMKQMELEEALKRKADRAGRKKKSAYETYRESLKTANAAPANSMLANTGLANAIVPGILGP